ncbi:HNH endonuclease [Nitratifractor salsuginis]|uniref:HNH endonuclease n=1 Tax=Nitratifractor salsuginis (strain DSM 16511 / JCM 12458 / E9I37-1) TaxID=749222 RepID=E6X1Q3_NITSE|nr:HNH endonuclease [Nitratifractor salsuginis]ADV47044.1 HNH endonuclease [Nitratifractor salsuginis DSM 16511]
MSKQALADYRAWLFDNHPVCQVCGMEMAQEAHHSKYGYFGAKKDDRSLVAVCRECHYQIHHGRRGVCKSRKEIEEIGEANWTEYQNAEAMA